jgi:hypothetical protein
MAAFSETQHGVMFSKIIAIVQMSRVTNAHC